MTVLNTLWFRWRAARTWTAVATVMFRTHWIDDEGRETGVTDHHHFALEVNLAGKRRMRFLRSTGSRSTARRHRAAVATEILWVIHGIVPELATPVV